MGLPAWVEGREEWLGLRENEGKKEKKRRGDRGVGMGERENQRKKMRENKRRYA